MPLELQEAVRSGDYILPDLLRLSTSFSQEQALQILREHVVTAFKLLIEKKHRIHRIMTVFTNGRDSSHYLLVNSHQGAYLHYSGSNTEQTMNRYSASNDTLPSSEPLVTKPDGLTYPNNPCIGFVSKWPDGFNGCLACSSTKHRFTSCSKKDNVEDKKLFWQKFWAHIPSTRERKCDPIPRLPTPPESNFDIHSKLIDSASSRNVLHHPNNDKRPRFQTIFARMTSISSTPKKPIHISFNNSLQSTNLHIGNLEDDKNRMRILVNTEAAMNTGSLDYHRWVMSQCPKMVEECVQCGKDTVYDVVHLLAALNIRDANQDVDHGKMTAVIRNKAPYIVKCRGPFILSFVLGHDVSLRCVLGLPTLLFIRTAINLLSGELAYTELDRTFPLTLDPPGKGLPDDAALNRCSSSIPPDVPINTISTTSLLQCTSSDGSLNPSWKDTPLDNIVVKDHFFKWCFP